MSPKEALDLTFTDPDSDREMTIRAYFKSQLSTLWAEGESFSGKRPFGNSGWEGYLELPLVQAGCIAGEIERDQISPDEYYDEVVGVDTREYDGFIQRMIEAL